MADYGIFSVAEYVTACLAALDRSREAAASHGGAGAPWALALEHPAWLWLPVDQGGGYRGDHSTREGPRASSPGFRYRLSKDTGDLQRSRAWRSPPGPHHHGGFSRWYRQRCRVDHAGVKTTTPLGDNLEPNAEQLERQAVTELLEQYGQDPELRRALALAWRCGFTRSQMQGHSTGSSSYVNPFW